MRSPVFQTEHFQQFLQSFLVDLPFVHQDGQGNILHHIQGGNEVVKLVDQPHLPPAENGQLFTISRIHILPV